MREFLEEHRGRGVLLQIGATGLRGIVHDLTDDAVVLWNPKTPFRTVPLDAVDGYTGWTRFDGLYDNYRRCVESQTCPRHYPAG